MPKIRLTLHIESLVRLSESRSIKYKDPSSDREIELVLGTDIGKIECVVLPMSEYRMPKIENKDMN